MVGVSGEGDFTGKILLFLPPIIKLKIEVGNEKKKEASANPFFIFTSHTENFEGFPGFSPEVAFSKQD